MPDFSTLALRGPATQSGRITAHRGTKQAGYALLLVAQDMARARRLVIVGAGGHGREIAETALAVNAERQTWDILGFLADGEAYPERAAELGLPILGGVDMLTELDAAYLIAIGAPEARATIDDRASTDDRSATELVHPAATLGTRVMLGPGCYVAAGAVLTTNVRLDRHTHVNVCASISHDVEIGRWCTIGPGAHVGGWVRLEDCVEIGIGAILRDRVTVGPRAVVGAGAVVVDDVPADTTVVGVPARPLARSERSRKDA